jgi:hypothetical protein
LFVFSKTSLASPGVILEHQLHDPDFFPTVAQVDLVPTLSLLLGLPVSFGNLGAIIPELFFGNYRHHLAIVSGTISNQLILFSNM